MFVVALDGPPSVSVPTSGKLHCGGQKQRHEQQERQGGRQQRHGDPPGGHLTAPTPTLGLHVVWRSQDRSPLVDALLAALDAAGPFTFTWRRRSESHRSDTRGEEQREQR